MSKRIYRKPGLAIESFELVEHIAGNCNGVESDSLYKVTHRSVENCALSKPDNPSVYLFISEANNCNYIEDAEWMNEPFDCYNAATANYAYFAS